MTTEKIEQLVLCIKECWWRVGVLLVILLGFTLTAMHGWPQGDWGLGWTSLAAIGGMAAGFGAFYAAYVALQIADKARSDKAEEDAAKRGVYEVVFVGAYAAVYDDVVQLKNSVDSVQSAEIGRYTATTESEFLSLISREGFFPIDGFIDNIESAIYFDSGDMKDLAVMASALRVIKESIVPDLAKHLVMRAQQSQSAGGAGILSAAFTRPGEEMKRLCSRLDAQLMSVIRLSCSIGFLREHMPNNVCQNFKQA